MYHHRLPPSPGLPRLAELKLCPRAPQPPPFPLPAPGTVRSPFSVCINLTISWVPQISGIIQDLSFCVWFLSLSVMSSRFLRVVASEAIPFLRLHNIPRCVSSSRGLCLVYPRICWWTLAIVTNAAVSPGVQGICVSAFRALSNPFERVPRSGTARSYGNSDFNLSRNCQAVFHSGCAILRSIINFHHSFFRFFK